MSVAFELPQNYTTFTTFLSISSCIEDCSNRELSSFLSKLVRLFDSKSRTSKDLLSLFKRLITSFIYVNVYNQNRNTKLILDSIYKLFNKRIRKDCDPSVYKRKKVSDKVHYCHLCKGKECSILLVFFSVFLEIFHE